MQLPARAGAVLFNEVVVDLSTSVDRELKIVDADGASVTRGLAVLTDAGRAAMEAVTADLEAVDFGLGMLDEEQHETLFGLLREVRVGARDFHA